MANERRPDGVKPGEFREEPNREPASSRPATPVGAMLAALPAGTSFPSGLKALEGKADDERVTVCNLTLKTARFHRTVGPQAVGKKGVIQVIAQPFETIEMSVAEARGVLAHQEAAAKRRPSPVFVVVGAFRGNCGGRLKFSAHGREFRTCPYHGCEHADHAERPYSVWQAQHFLRTLKTPEAIDRFVTAHDLRDAVVSLATYERTARERAHREEQMMASNAGRSAEAVY